MIMKHGVRLVLTAMLGALIAASEVHAANGTAYYFDVNGTSFGFGDPSGSYNEGSTYWGTAPEGSASAVALPAGAQITFGYTGVPGMAGDTFTISMNGNSWAGLQMNAPCTVTLSGTANAYLSAVQTWAVPEGGVLTQNQTYNGFGLNYNNQGLTLSGNGAINFDSDVGYNSTATITESMTFGTVNMRNDWSAGAANQGSYTLSAGTLNFGTANVFNGMQTGRLLTLSGGTVDNTGGSALTLGLGSGTYSIGGNITFAGSSDLSFGTKAVALGTAVREITVAARKLTIGGVASGAAGGITKFGSGTLVLSGANTYTGATSVRGGQLLVDAGAGGALYGTSPYSALSFSDRGVFTYDNTTATGAKAQNMGALTFAAGDATVQITRTAAQTVTLTFSSLGARSAGVMRNFVYAGTSGTIGTDSSINLTGAAAGFLDAGSYVNGSSYAWMNALGTYIRPYVAGDANYVAVAGGSTMGTRAATDNVALSGSITAQTTANGSVNTVNLGAFNVTMNSSSDVLEADGLLCSGTASGSVSGGRYQPKTASGEMIVRVNGASDTLTIGSIIQNKTGASSLTKGGDGTLVLGAVNTLTGTTRVGGGVLRLGLANAIPAAGAVTVCGGTYDLGGFSAANGTVTMSSGGITNGTLTGSAYTFTDRGAVSAVLAGSATLTKTGNGTVAISSASTIGSLTIGTASAGGTLSVQSGGSLTIGSGASHNWQIASAGGGGSMDASAAAAITANVANLGVNGTGTTSSPGFLRLGTNNTITALTSVRIGDGQGNAAGAVATVTTALNGSTTIYTPLMNIGYTKNNVGSFTLGSGSTLTLAGVSGGSAQLNVGWHETDTGGSNGRIATGTLDASWGTVNFTLSKLYIGLETMASSVNNGGLGTVLLGSNPANSLSIIGAGNAVRVGYSSSTVAQSQASIGTLSVGHLGSGSTITSTDNDTAVLIGYKTGSALATGTVNLMGGTVTLTTTGSAIAGGGGTSTLRLSNCTLIAGASSSTWIQNLTTATLTNSVTLNSGAFDVTVPQAFSGSGSLVKAGAGTLTLTGGSTFTGATTINAGQLKLSAAGTINSTSGITVDGATAELMVKGATAISRPVAVTQGTLRGTGAIDGAVTVGAAGVVAPGDAAIGTLSFGSTLALDPAGTVVARINKTGAILTADQIAMTAGTGSVNFQGTLTVTLAAGSDALAGGNAFVLFTKGASGSFSGSFSTINLPALDAGLSWDTSSLAVNGSIQVMAEGAVASPLFTPAPGGYLGGQSVSLSCSTPGATIYYTTDGSTPTTESPVYSGPIAVDVDTVMTIQAYAVKDGSTDSDVVLGTYATTSTAKWTADANGSWPDSGNWLYGVVAGGSGACARFDVISLSATRTVTLDNPITVGSITFADVGNQYGWVLSPGTGSLTLDAAVPTITVNNQTATLAVAPTIANGLTKSGAGTLVLGVANTYPGTTTISAGTLRLGASNVIPDGSGKGGMVVTGTLDMGGYSDTINGLSGAGTVDNTVGTGAYTLSVGNNNVNSTFSGTVTSTLGTLALTKIGTGTLTLDGAARTESLNIATGAASGPVFAGSGSAITVGSGSGDHLYVGVGANSGTLDVSAASSFIVNVGELYVGVNNNVNLASVGTLTLGANNSITAVKVVMGGNEPDSDQSSGHVATITTLAGGTTTIVSPDMALGTSKGTGNFTLGSGATLHLGTSGSRMALVIGRSDTGNGYDRPGIGNMSLSAGIADLYFSQLVLGRKTVSGATTSTAGTLTLSSNAANHLDVSGTGSVIRVGYSTVSGFGATGTLTVGNLDAGSAVTSTDNSTAIGVAVGALTTGTLNLNGGTLTLTTTGAAIAGGGGTSTLVLGNTTGNGSGMILKAGASSSGWITGLTTARIKATGVTFDTNGNGIEIPQSLLVDATSTGGGLTKAGAGTLTLTGASTYTGATAINAGQLRLSGTGVINGSSGVSINGATAELVASGVTAVAVPVTVTQGTLRGTGAIDGAVTLGAAGVLAAGDTAIGTLSFGSTLALNATGSVVARINKSGATTSADQVAMTAPAGSLAYDGTLTVTLEAGSEALAGGDTFTLFSKGAGGTFSGSFSTINLPVLGPSLSWDTTSLAVNGSIQVVAEGVVASPVFTPAAGGHLGAQNITITCATDGATIYFTTDGSVPTTASAVYATPIAVAADTVMTIRAFAVKDGSTDSAVVSGTFSTTSAATWVVDVNGSWPVGANWLYEVVGDGSGATVLFNTVTLSANRAVTLDSPVTVGSITFGDVGNLHGWTLNPGVGGSLTFDAAVPTITVDNQTATLAVAPTSANGLTKSGAGTLVFGVANTYPGTTTISAGTLRLGASNVIPDGSGKGNVVLNGMLDMGGFSDTINGLSGAGAVGNTVGTGTYTLTVGANNVSSTFSGTIAPSSGKLSLNKTGTGTLTHDGAATLESLYANSGAIVLGSSGAMSVGSGATSLFYVGAGYGGANYNGTLDLSGGGSLTANVGKFFVGVSDAAASGGTGVGTLKLGNSSITATSFVVGGIEPDGNTSANNGGSVTVAAGATVTLSTPVMAVGTTKNALGSSFTLGTGATLNLGSLGSRTELTVGRHMAWTYIVNPGVMDLSGGGTGVARLYLNRLVLGIYTGGTTGNSTPATGTLTLSASGLNHLDVSGTSSALGGVVVLGYTDNLGGGAGIGTLTIPNLTADSSITATDNGTAILIARKGTVTPVGTLNLFGGTLTISTTGSAIAGGGGTSTLNLNGGATLKAGGSSSTWIQSLTSATITNSAVIDSAGYLINVAQAFAGSGALVKSGAGTLSLSGSNSYGGGTTVNGGTLALGADNAFGPGLVTLDGGGIGSYGGAARSLTNTITLAGAGTVDTTGGDISLSGAIGGASSLTKLGSGALTLSSANSYGGGTTVTGGTLTVSGAATLGSGNVTVTAGTLRLATGTGDAIGDSRRLTVAAGATVQLDSNETVNELALDGALVWKGTWGGAGSGASYVDSHFSGSGILTVKSGAPHPATLIQFL